MSLIGSLDRSTISILSKTPARLATRPAQRLHSRMRAIAADEHRTLSMQDRLPQERSNCTDQTLEAFFIGALVRAGTCSKHVSNVERSSKPDTFRLTRRRKELFEPGVFRQRREYHSGRKSTASTEPPSSRKSSSSDQEPAAKRINTAATGEEIPDSSTVPNWWKWVIKAQDERDPNNDAKSSSVAKPAKDLPTLPKHPFVAANKTLSPFALLGQDRTSETDDVSSDIADESMPAATNDGYGRFRRVKSWEPIELKPKGKDGRTHDLRYEFDPARIPRRLDDENAEKARYTLCKYLDLLRNRNSGSREGEKLYSLYIRLPKPGVEYLWSSDITSLLIRLETVERPNQASTVRFLNVLDDLRVASLPIERRFWDAAIWFAGLANYAHVVPQTDLDNAVAVYKSMQSQAIRPSEKTYALLFAIATKAEDFDLALRFANRYTKLRPHIDRYMHLNFVNFYARKGDADSVRRTYREFVESGQVIDTVALNCVIAAMLRLEEWNAAEKVFARMKELDQKKDADIMDDHHKTDVRRSAREYKYELRRRKPGSNHLEYIRELARVSPDAQTYKLMIGYTARKAGDIDRALRLMEEMHNAGIPPQGSNFKHLLDGFGRFGPESPWTRDRLERTWKQFTDLVDRDGEARLDVRKGMVFMAISAFARCTDKDRLQEVWDWIDKRWEIDDATRSRAQKIVARYISPPLFRPRGSGSSLEWRSIKHG